ncbi:MAG: ACT domain-containing protein [Actinobacteria bacterium]|nr:ACT domain-containing protein [Actinomycetota bacterium]
MAVDIVIEVENKPGELAKLAAAVSDAGVNLAAATFTGTGDAAQLHILVKHAEPVRHALAITHADIHPVEREVVVVDMGENPALLGDLAREIGDAGVNIDTVYVATNNRVVFHSTDMDGLRKALGAHATHLH